MIDVSQQKELVELAQKIFDCNEAIATEWLKSPKQALGGKTPLDYADTESSTEEVINYLGAIEHGVFL